MTKPAWCTKPAPCDYDKGSAYCVHRECRQQLEAQLLEQGSRLDQLQKDLLVEVGKKIAAREERSAALDRLNSGIEILERWKAASVPGSNDWTGGPPEWALAALKATGSGTAPAGGGRNAEAAQSDFPTWVRCATPGCILVGGHQDRSSCTDKDFRTIAVETSAPNCPGSPLTMHKPKREPTAFEDFVDGLPKRSE